MPNKFAGAMLIPLGTVFAAKPDGKLRLRYRSMKLGPVESPNRKAKAAAIAEREYKRAARRMQMRNTVVTSPFV